MLKMKKLLAFLLASGMMCTAFTACGSDEESSETAEESSVEESSEAEEESSEDAEESSVRQVEMQEFEEAVVPESGDAYLSITDSRWWLQYFGNDTDYLTYDAGVVPITGNGDYTVSVTCNTDAIRYDTTGDANGELIASGSAFMAVQILDGADVCPDAIITINSVVVDGVEIALTKKSYTSTETAEVSGEDHNNIRSNIYNEWVSDDSLPDDARSDEGTLTDLEDFLEYSAMIIDPSEIGE
ncbi:MAG: hypothetical protein LUC50_02655 [Ruminococcus sp.]|nr:hypothetical protein [Ruminococcus sp.]